MTESNRIEFKRELTDDFIRFTVPFYKNVTDETGKGEGVNPQKHVEENVEKEGIETSQKTLQKTPQKTPQKIVDLIKKNPNITTQEMAAIIGIDRSNIARSIKKLQERGVVRRVGPDKGGHWEVIENKEKTE